MFGAAATVGAAVVVGKVVATLKETAVAWRFGTGDELDAFSVALLVPLALINVTGGSLQTAFLPAYFSVHEQEGGEAADALVSAMSVWGGVALTLVAALITLTAPLYLPYIAPGFGPQKLGLTFRLLCLTAPLLLVSSLASLWGAALNARGRFALASVAPVVTPLVTMLLVAAGALGIFALPVALLAGASLELLTLGAGLRRVGVRFRPGASNLARHLRRTARDCWPLTLSSLLLGAAGLVQLALAARLSAGSVAAWNYANKLAALPAALTATAVGTAVAPFFSGMAARRDFGPLGETFRQSLKLVLAVTVPLAAGLMLFSEELTRLVFQRGAFAADDARQVSAIFFFLALQLPFSVAGALAARVLVSLRATWPLAAVSATGLAVNAALSWLLVGRMGAPGLGLATGAMYLTSFVALTLLARRRLRRGAG